MVKLARILVLAALTSGAAQAALAAGDPSMPPLPAEPGEAAATVWLHKYTSLGVGQFVVFGPDNVVVVLTDEIATRTPQMHHITFRQEATKVDFVGRTGGRSLRGAGDVDCQTGTFKAEYTELYSGSDLRGDRISREGAEAAAHQPPAGTATSSMITAVCGAKPSALAPLAEASAPRATTATAAETTPPVPASSRPDTEVRDLPPLPPAPPPPAPPATAAPPPPAAPPPAPASATAVAAAAPKPAAALPKAAAAKPAAPAPAAPAQAAQASSYPPETVAQIGAFATREAGERAWKRLADNFPAEFAGKGIRIEQVVNNGTTAFRTSVDGFASAADAQALCTRLMASSEACFVRKEP